MISSQDKKVLEELVALDTEGTEERDEAVRLSDIGEVEEASVHALLSVERRLAAIALLVVELWTAYLEEGAA